MRIAKFVPLLYEDLVLQGLSFTLYIHRSLGGKWKQRLYATLIQWGIALPCFAETKAALDTVKLLHPANDINNFEFLIILLQDSRLYRLGKCIVPESTPPITWVSIIFLLSKRSRHSLVQYSLTKWCYELTINSCSSSCCLITERSSKRGTKCSIICLASNFTDLSSLKVER